MSTSRYLGVLLLAATSAYSAGAALAGTPGPAAPPELGQPVTTAELETIDITVMPDGQGLPTGSGDVAGGAEVYRVHCLACHGPEGHNGSNDRLVGGTGSLATAAPVKTVGSYWPYATTLFDYVRRAMPYTAPGSLSGADVYAVTAYLLHLNGILSEDASLDAQTLPDVVMPNRHGFTSARD